MAELTNLKRLNASSTKVSNLGSLARLTNLEQLDVSNTLVADVVPLAKLPRLAELDLSRTAVRDLSLGDRIEATALDVLEGLIEAIYMRAVSAILARVNLLLETLRFLIRVADEGSACDSMRTSPRSYDYQSGAHASALRRCELAFIQRETGVVERSDGCMSPAGVDAARG